MTKQFDSASEYTKHTNWRVTRVCVCVWSLPTLPITEFCELKEIKNIGIKYCLYIIKMQNEIRNLAYYNHQFWKPLISHLHIQFVTSISQMQNMWKRVSKLVHKPLTSTRWYHILLILLISMHIPHFFFFMSSSLSLDYKCCDQHSLKGFSF